MTSYEIGYKANLFDRRLRLAIAGFYADYTDVQVPGSVGAVINGIPTFVGVTTNAGAAHLQGRRGGSCSRTCSARDNGSRLNFSGTLGYLDAQYDEFITNIPGQGPVDVADFRRIQNTPKWTLSGTLDFTTPVMGGDLSMSTTALLPEQDLPVRDAEPLSRPAGLCLVGRASVLDQRRQSLHDRPPRQEHPRRAIYHVGLPVPGHQPDAPACRSLAGGNPIPSLGREGVATAFYGNPRQVFLSLGFNFR